jgi:hypothetical protein
MDMLAAAGEEGWELVAITRNSVAYHRGCLPKATQTRRRQASRARLMVISTSWSVLTIVVERLKGSLTCQAAWTSAIRARGDME